ncbi:hypothetical protein ABZ404_37155 [Streptomyces sp. NPDC005878]|uniref:hypothetical protein n=1 Tax=Streptomyces sp. NPDC005878 TaxID=3157077 RepID=UPI0033D27566
MSQTGTDLRTAKTLANFFGVLDHGQHYAHPDGRLHPAAVIYRATTGTTPTEFYDNPDTARALIQSNATVMTALRWVSAVLPTQPPGDDITGDDHLEHLDTWWSENDFFLHRRPNTCEFIGILDRAAQAADTLTDLPAPRTAA